VALLVIPPQTGIESISDGMPQMRYKEMIRVEKTTMSGRDMRTYRCDHCKEEHIVDYGMALWKAMSDDDE
jgi:ribosomal protein L37AE/L43A